MESTLEKKSIFSTLKGKVTLLSLTAVTALPAFVIPSFAELEKEKAVEVDPAKAALNNAGIDTTSKISGETGDSLMGSMTDLVYVIMGIGALWSVAWIIIGGMLLAGSGSNPQKRSGGLVAIAVAAVGIYVIYKAYTIAGWAAAL